MNIAIRIIVAASLLPALAVAQSGADEHADSTVEFRVLRESLGPVRSVQRVSPGDRLTDMQGADRLDFGTADYVAVKLDREVQFKTNAAGRTLGTLPTEILVSAGSGAVRRLQIRFESSGLAWNLAEQAHVGDLLLGVVDGDSPNESRRLPSAIQMQIVAPNDAASPTSISIPNQGLPFQNVSLKSVAPPEPFTIKVLASFDTEGTVVPVPVQRSSLIISVTPNSINGYGVESADVTVRSSDGGEAAGSVIVLSATRGILADTRLKLDSTGIASTKLRSSGTGSARLDASGGRFLPGEAVIEFDFPKAFLIALGLGAALGGLVWAYLLSVKKPRSRGLRFVDWLAGTGAGIGLTAAVFARIDLSEYLPLPEELQSEVTAFAIAFLAALLGVTISRALIKAKGGDP